MRRHEQAAALVMLLVTVSLHASPLAGSASASGFNPLRGDTRVIEAGRIAYQKHCAECHGEEAIHPLAEAPDLRRLDSFCRRLKDPALQAHCRDDVDRYYLRSVNEGKVRAGVVHMAPWEGRLTVDEIWSIRTFVETRPRGQPRQGTAVGTPQAAQKQEAATR